MSSYVPIDTNPNAQRTSGSPEENEMITVSTVAATATGAGHHMLKVSDYSRLKATHAGKNGSCIESCPFTAGGHTWTLRCYLNGQKEEDAGFVSLFLRLTDAADAATTVVNADFELALVHHQQGRLAVLCRPPPSYCVSAIRPISPGMQCGCPRFIGVKTLESSLFLKDDCFAVRCKVTVVEERPCVKEGVVLAQDLQRLGLMLCRCSDATCKRHHVTPLQTLWEAFARMCRSIFG